MLHFIRTLVPMTVSISVVGLAAIQTAMMTLQIHP